MNAEKILVVEDEFVTGSEIQARLQDMGYEVPDVVDTGEEAIEKAGALQPDIVVMDITLKGAMNGIEAAETIRARYNIPVVYLTAHSDEATVDRALHSEPFGYLVKPLDERTLKSTIKMALYKHEIDAKLRRSEETVRALLNATKDEIVLIDGEGRIVAFNGAFAQSAGKPAPELTGTVAYELIKTGGLTMRTAEELQKKTGAGPVTFGEEDGDRWVETTIYPVTDPSGVRREVAVFRHDLSAIKRAEREREEAVRSLEAEKERLVLLASALDNMSDCAIITDANGFITYVNNTFEKKFAIPRDTAITKHISEFAHPDNRYPLTQETFIRYPEIDNIAQFTAKNAYGVKMPMTLRSRPIVREYNRPKYFVFVLRESVG